MTTVENTANDIAASVHPGENETRERHMMRELLLSFARLAVSEHNLAQVRSNQVASLLQSVPATSRPH